jgi:DNA processing protein
MAVSLSRGVGPAAAGRLRAEYGSYLAVVRAALGQARCYNAMPKSLAGAIAASARSHAHVTETDLARREGARFALPGEGDYPRALECIASAPVGIYVVGDKLSSLVPMVGVVGTRTPTPRGSAMAAELAADLAREGVTVVSGMARGVDSSAHRGAIEAGGRTVAVMGCGLSHTYPPENDALRRDIARKGSLVSEFPMRAEPLPGRFPRRNRIIAGLSAGVVVVEAAARSGALITAARALEEGREVFAVPGPVDEPLSVGPNRLIKAGAKLVEDAGDVLDELARAWGPFPVPRPDWHRGSRRTTDVTAGGAGLVGSARDGGRTGGVTGSDLPTVLGRMLTRTPVSVDELVVRTGAAVSDVLSALLKLELAGWAERTSGGRYARGPRVAIEGP